MVGGDFQYWFDGQLYRNLMRLDASFRPDPSWRPVIDDPVAVLTTDRDGRLLVGSNSSSKTQGRIARFNTDGTLDSRLQALVKGDVYKLLAASDGMLFVGGAFSAVNNVPRNSLARFRADSTLDPDWASQPTWPILQPGFAGFGSGGIARILDAGSDGVFFVWVDAYMNGAIASVERLAREGTGAKLTVPAALAAGPEYATGGGSMMRDPANGAIYAIASAWELPPTGAQEGTALIRLLAPSMAIDPAWTTVAGPYGRQFVSFAYQTDSHVYVCRGYVNGDVRRIDKATGREDPNWSSNETFLCGADPVERLADGSTLVFSSGIYGPFARYSTTASNTPVNVVEYYSRDAKRFFITGRANEIAQLDALSANFVRTGMTFAAETALVRTADTTRTPICRFYAPPEAGGSNTHFYGRESDFSTLRYEGHDFRAGVPTNGACPVALPTRVFRLFNNGVASNNGNHRYVVSDTRRVEMLAAGWSDEGVAFCTVNAVDSRELALIR